MRALVTGASGFVGRHLVPALRAAGWSVLTLDRRGPADLVGDLADVPLRGVRADAVFHLAGFANPSASLDAPGEAYAANAAGTARLVRGVRARRFVLASSCQVYGREARRARETDPARPASPYAASKLCGEALALASGRDVVVLRPFNHTGPGQGDAYVCPRIARQVARAEAGLEAPVVEVADLAPRRDFFDVRDMVRAYLAAFARGRRGAVYNVCTGRPVAIGAIARLLAGMARRPLKVRGPSARGDVLSGDPSRFAADAGWRAEIPLRRTLEDLLAFERAVLRL